MAVTRDDVRSILPTGSTFTDEQVDNAIIDACCIIDPMLTLCLSGMSEECTDRIKTYLAAHFLAATDQALSLQSEAESCGKSSVTYGNGNTGILSTTFGQRANTLAMGCLIDIDKRPAQLIAVGCI